MYISRVACINGGLPQDTTALTREPPVRQRPAGDRQRVAVDPARRHRRRGRRRRRIMSRGGYLDADAALGRAHGRRQDRST